MKQVRLYILVGFILLSTRLNAQSFKSEEFLRYVEILSHDSLEGRKTGTKGGLISRTLIEDVYKKFKLRTFNTYKDFQQIRVKEDTIINIVGYIEGTQSPEKYLVISAHYDHLGIINGEIYKGADDNASGVGGLLAAIQYFTTNPSKNSIIFAAFDAEEVNLTGSNEFIKNPPVPLEKIILNVNMDMISRSDKKEIYICGTYHYPFLKPLLETLVNEDSTIILKFGHDRPNLLHPGDDWTFSSDHGPFHQRKIPFLYFGVEDHEDYHKPSDTFDKIDKNFYIASVELIIESIKIMDNNSALIEEKSGRIKKKKNKIK